MSNIKLKLKKKFYGLSGALDSLDYEFNQFQKIPTSVKEFFKLHSTNFYEFKRKTHFHFLNKSTDYAYPEGFENERKFEIIELENQLRDLQRQIDSLEKEHFYFKNYSFLILDNSDIIGPFGNLKEIGPQIGPFLMQSGKKRYIESLDLYAQIKAKTLKGSVTLKDEDVLIKLSQQTLNGIADGPPILGTTNANNILIDNLEVNIYPRTLEEYNSQNIDLLLDNIIEGTNELNETRN
tara:strand:- start:9522 stop:10232 length:711 start_codon:yes stop_codon:yes gene_type:complete